MLIGCNVSYHCDRDSGGWEEKRDETRRTFYENSQTGDQAYSWIKEAKGILILACNIMIYAGEIVWEKPMLLQIAETMASFASASAKDNEVAKYKRIAEDTKQQMRQQQV